MVHCPECETTISKQSDIDFEKMDAKHGLFQASKQFYVAACDHCGAAIGTGVAGEKH